MHVEGAARWALERLEEMFTPDIAAVVLLDPATRTWHVSAGSGVRTGTSGAAPWSSRPPCTPWRRGPNRSCSTISSRDSASGRAGACTAPCAPGTRWWACCASKAATGARPGPKDRRRIGDLARAAALAIDNARWLERIHTLGMEQERTPPGARAARPHRAVGGVPRLRARPPGRAQPRAGRAGRSPGPARRRARPGRGAARHARRPALRRVGDPGRRRGPAVVPRDG